ncbi:MAG: bifunctional 23S rRNA (guanine(2069)-N(7))-methyltransferase RlmK/23S rRNA (guanine(2445)-N(2))-methyltransferase RlmL [Gammaproteobacteria bacterium]|nr:MAG: bifunctional 23S rRNA (guanine(2069)-N(7))-methyltransferase RlmK/23S rRNA (guanine(2445)-N(2))-methyltransferase RlmL [Gammaproteobacteria bacterium]
MNQRTVSEESKTYGGTTDGPTGGSIAFFATGPRDLIALLRRELIGFGAQHLRAGHAGARFRGTLEVAYRACLWSRLANRILLPLKSFQAATPEQLYAGVRGIAWGEQVPAGGTLAVDFSSSRSRMRHTHFGAQKVKDAIVDQLRELTGARPSVDRVRPDVRINAHVDRDVATIAIDLSGDSLHRRGYRRQSGPAPLKENVAAAILLLARWPEMAAAGKPLLDPMCGSGTLLIEAALMAADVAPGLTRDYFGLHGWCGHDAPLWQRLLDEARQRRRDGIPGLPPIAGFDIAAKAVQRAADNLAAVGLEEHIEIRCQAVAALRSPWPERTGLLVCNPPYGERLGARDQVGDLYAGMGEVFRTGFAGWRLAFLAGAPALDAHLGLQPRHSHKLDNGPLACRLTHYEIPAGGGANTGAPTGSSHARPARGARSDPNASMFANRLRKNLRNVGGWARRNSVDCYRLYDADMPEYAFAVDVYRAPDMWIVAQEYQAPASIPEEQAAARRGTVLETLEGLLEVPAERVVFKTRRRHTGGSQYQRLATDDTLHEVREHDCRLLVNFSDRLDTGLFLDHRQIRQLVRSLAAGRRFLNLFAYTGAATVHAAAGGATATTSVDLSAGYLDWARRNLELNGFCGPRHLQVQADCLEWLGSAPDDDQGYGVVLLDAPTFSNSKRMADTLDVQRDHASLIRMAAQRLTADGVLIFSCHLKRFRMDRGAVGDAGLDLEDITRKTIPRDFARDPRTHHCWRIRHRH